MLTGFAVTERARRLRSNYNLHAQSLRTRIEMRVNRIPVALRKLTMGELMERYEQQKLSASTGGTMKSLKDSATSRPALSRSMTAAVPSFAPAKRKRFVEFSQGSLSKLLTLST